ncbi:MAG: glycosyltransferase family 4 protein [Lachnospiraceae bacterium]|nr:glycosyltransferase family 4 protein [Lachnospiraceae bacterium]
MKVLMMGNRGDTKGGITSVIRAVRSVNWADRGVDLRFLPTYTDAGSGEQVRVFLNAVRKMSRALKVWKPDLVYVHMSYKGSFVRASILQIMCLKSHTRMVVHVHGSSIEEWYEGLGSPGKKKVRKFFEACSHVIVLGEHYRAFFHAMAPAAHVSVLYNTVVEQEAASSEESPSGIKRILFMGVLIRRKGVEDLVNAFSSIKQKGTGEGWKLMIAGTGEEEAALREQAESLGLSASDVEFAGWTEGDKKDALYQKAQIFVLPSYREGLPMAVLEAMSFGLPVVATDVGDMREAVCDGENGILIAPGHPEQIEEALTALMQDETLRRKYGEVSRNKIHAKFSSATYADHLYSIWKGVL